MTTFLEAFEALMDEQFKGRARFQELTGASSAYLTDIFKWGKLPRPAKLDEWLTKAEVPEEKREYLLFLCRLDKLKEDADLAPLADYFEGRISSLSRTLGSMAKVCDEAGVKLPGDLIKKIKALDLR